MRLEVRAGSAAVHSDLASSCGWNAWGELWTASDDQTIQKWSPAGEPEGKVRQQQGGWGSLTSSMHGYLASDGVS